MKTKQTTQTQTTGDEKMKTATSSTETWIVEYSDHDCEAPGGNFIRKTEKQAKRSARLMKECGYETTSYRQWTR